jgi:hypothetical protein
VTGGAQLAGARGPRATTARALSNLPGGGAEPLNDRQALAVEARAGGPDHGGFRAPGLGRGGCIAFRPGGSPFLEEQTLTTEITPLAGTGARLRQRLARARARLVAPQERGPAFWLVTVALAVLLPAPIALALVAARLRALAAARAAGGQDAAGAGA